MMAAALVMVQSRLKRCREVVVAGHNGEEFLLGEKNRRQQELVPDAERDDQSDGKKPGPGKRHHDSGEDLPFTCSIDTGRILEIARELHHEGAQAGKWRTAH